MESALIEGNDAHPVEVYYSFSKYALQKYSQFVDNVVADVTLKENTNRAGAYHTDPNFLKCYSFRFEIVIKELSENYINAVRRVLCLMPRAAVSTT